jgi:hypothetical protein
MIIFDYNFRHLPSEHLEDLTNLLREGAVYGFFCFEDTQESHSCRIPFSASEIADYVKASIAYDEFLGHMTDLGDPARVAAFARRHDSIKAASLGPGRAHGGPSGGHALAGGS